MTAGQGEIGNTKLEKRNSVSEIGNQAIREEPRNERRAPPYQTQNRKGRASHEKCKVKIASAC